MTRPGLPVVLPVVSGIGLAPIAATLRGAVKQYLYWMLPIMGIILSNATTNSWERMLGLAMYEA